MVFQLFHPRLGLFALFAAALFTCCSTQALLQRKTQTFKTLETTLLSSLLHNRASNKLKMDHQDGCEQCLVSF